MLQEPDGRGGTEPVRQEQRQVSGQGDLNMRNQLCLDLSIHSFTRCTHFY